MPPSSSPRRGARGAFSASRAAGRAALCCALLAGHCAAFTIFSRPPRSVTCRFVLERATEQPRQKIVRKSTQTTWDERYRELSTYRSTWGTADAPLGDSLGRWCRTQRQQHAEGKLSEERIAKLDALVAQFALGVLLALRPAPPAQRIAERRVGGAPGATVRGQFSVALVPGRLRAFSYYFLARLGRGALEDEAARYRARRA